MKALLLIVMNTSLILSACSDELQNVDRTQKAADGRSASEEGGEPSLRLSGSSTYPVYSGDPSLICNNEQFHDLNGKLMRGAKNCDYSNLVPDNVRYGVSISGVAGNLTPGTFPTCANDGEGFCMADGAIYVSVQKANLMPQRIMAGISIGGVTGNFPSAANPLPLATATTDLTSLDTGTATGSYEFFDSAGNRYTGSIADGGTVTPGASNQTISAAQTVYRQFTVAGDTDLDASHITSGVTLFGVSGSLVAVGPCTAANQSGCVSTSTYRTMDLSSAGSGTGLTTSNFNSTIGSAGNFEFWDASGAMHSVAGDSDLASANIRSSVTLFGNAGSLVPSPAACASDGGILCVADGTNYVAALKSRVVAGNIKNGASVGGVNGTYPSASTPLASATATTDLISLAPATATGGYEFFDSAGSRYTGTIADGGTVTAGTGSQAINAADTLYRQLIVAGDADLVAAKILSGTNIFGVNGSATASPAACAADGGSACVVDGTNYVAAQKSLVTAGNIKNGVTIGAVAGTYPSASTPLAGDTAATDLTSLDPATATGGYEFFDSAGSRYAGTIADGGTVTPGTSNQTISAASTLYRQITVAGDADLVAANVLSSVSLFAVSGSATASPGACTGANQSACVTTAIFKSMDLSSLGGGGATGVTAANFNSKLASAGTFEFWDAAGTRHTKAGSTSLAAANIRSGVTLFDAAGSVTPTPANCASDGTSSCVVEGTTYIAIDTTNLTAGNIKNGVTFGGVTGTYPSASTRLAAGTASTDLTSLDPATATGAYEFFDSAGARYTGSIADGGPVTAGASNQTISAANTVYRQFTVSGDSDLLATNIRSGTQIFAVTGSVTPNPADCTGNNQSGCVAISGYSAADWTNLTAANIKNGADVAGVTGTYPSAGNLLTGFSGTADLDSTSFNSKMVSATAFEYWTSDGTRQTGAGDTDLAAANIKSGVTILGVAGTSPGVPNCSGDGQVNCWAAGNFKSINPSGVDAWTLRAGLSIGGVAGKLRTNCREQVRSATFNYDGSLASLPSTGVTSGTSADWWDISTAWSGAGSTVSGWDANTVCDASADVWQDMTPDGACDSDADNCVFRDRISGFFWTESNPVSGAAPTSTDMTWADAVARCASLGSFGGINSWRVPSQMELYQAYLHGFRFISNNYFRDNSTNTTWSSTSRSSDASRAYEFSFFDGWTTDQAKNNPKAMVFCVD